MTDITNARKILKAIDVYDDTEIDDDEVDQALQSLAAALIAKMPKEAHVYGEDRYAMGYNKARQDCIDQIKDYFGIKHG